MENWGLIMYQEDALLYDEKVSSQLEKHVILILIAHEMAHQVSAYLHDHHNDNTF